MSTNCEEEIFIYISANVFEHGVLLHDQLIPGHQQGDQLLIQTPYLGQVVILDKLQLGHIQPRDGALVYLTILEI